jgi:hypothetical protein
MLTGKSAIPLTSESEEKGYRPDTATLSFTERQKVESLTSFTAILRGNFV